MPDTNERNLIRLADPEMDQSVYRIYAVDRFKGLLTSGMDALVNPSKWDDPFENFFLQRTDVMDSVDGPPIPLSNLAQYWYGQCWSLNEDTDAMWRIYNPDPATEAGVKVRTTIRKLFGNLKKAGSPAPYLQFFIGKVAYITETDINDLMDKLTFMDIAMGGQGNHFANLLCIKRTAFEHEAEIRLLFQDDDVKRGANGVFPFQLDVNQVFEEVVLDPRIGDHEADTLKSDLKSLGCTLPIDRSQLYQSPKFTIRDH